MYECINIFLDRPPVNHVLHFFVSAMSIPSQAIYFAFTFREYTHELVGVCVAFAPTSMPIFSSIVHIHIAYYYNLAICSAFFIYIFQNVHLRFEIANFASRMWHIYCYHKQRHILKVYLYNTYAVTAKMGQRSDTITLRALPKYCTSTMTPFMVSRLVVY